MGYARYDTPAGPAGYGVEDRCPYPLGEDQGDQPCGTKIDRGLDFLCGDQPGYATELGCGRWFCGEHLVGSPAGGAVQNCPTCAQRIAREWGEE
jgi:hypothetical protein